jgi:hypothetical protein
MSIDPQNLNSTSYRTPYYIEQKHENEHRLRHKKQLDDQIMDNILKINLFIFLLCLLAIGFFFIIDAEIVVFTSEEKNGKFVYYFYEISARRKRF